MAVTHEAILSSDEDQPITLTDPESLESAKLFKVVSDGVWASHPEGTSMAQWGVASVVDPKEALDEIVGQLSDINRDLVLTNGAQDLTLSGSYDRTVTVPRQLFAKPAKASLNTFNWDSIYGLTRNLIINDGFQLARFTDGHQDYARELEARFRFNLEDEGEDLVLSYTIQRWQYYQNKNIDIVGQLWYSGFAEQGYEGGQFGITELTEDQEMKLMNSFARIGGISLSGLNTASV